LNQAVVMFLPRGFKCIRQLLHSSHSTGDLRLIIKVLYLHKWYK